MNVFGRIEAGADRRLTALRRRSRVFDHVWRAGVRYNEVFAVRLAAAIAYYGFFAAFALALIGYAVFGAILEDNDEVSRAAAGFLRENLPFLDPVQIADSSGRVGVGSAISALICRPQGRRGRLPSLTRRRTWALGSCCQRASVCSVVSKWFTRKGRMANSPVKRIVRSSLP